MKTGSRRQDRAAVVGFESSRSAADEYLGAQSSPCIRSHHSPEDPGSGKREKLIKQLRRET
jgi:hypothetical protein